MRDIKFRAWDKTEGRISYVADLSTNEINGRLGARIRRANGTMAFRAGEGEIVLMQYTGLKDKNGVEIYEGDIVTFKSDSPFPIVFVDGAFGTQPDENRNIFYSLASLVYARNSDVQVIGNIYENPELLEKAV